MTPRIALLATFDTKRTEARFVANRIREFGAEPYVIDLGTNTVDDDLIAISGPAVRELADDRDVVAATEKLQRMQRTVSGGTAHLRQLIDRGDIGAALAIGGGQGSWIASGILRQLPVGFPRLLVSTAGRDVGQYTQFSDIFNVFSITDVAGTNPILRRVLTNAAAAACGLVRSTAWRDPLPAGLVAISVYGITTAGATEAMRLLKEQHIEAVSFHANGVGGPTMEQQIAAGTFRAVLDWSITEVADEVLGGVCSAGPERLTNAPRLGLPQLIVPGGIDVVNFGAPATMPAAFQGRLTHAHTPEATLLRTNPAENRRIAELVASRLNATTAPVRVLVPLGGFSALSAAGGPLSWREADDAFADSLQRARTNPLVTIETSELAINDPAFAALAVERFTPLLDLQLA